LNICAAKPFYVEKNTEPETLVERLSTLLEATNDMCYVYDKAGCLTYVNQKLLDFMQYTADEALGRHILGFTPLDCHPTQKQELERRLVEGVPHRHETYITDRSGRRRLVHISALPMIENQEVSGVIALACDITQQRQLEEALLETRQKYGTVFQFSPQLLVISRLEDGKILEVNDSALNMWGYTREEVIGTSTIEQIFWVDLNERKSAVELLRQGIPLHNFEIRFYDGNGNIHTGLWSADTMELEGQTCIISIAVDITLRMQTEQSLQEFKEKIAQAERVAALGALAAGVVHEIAQPINALKILTDALSYNVKMRQPLPPERITAYLADMANEVAHLEGIIKHMRSFAHDDSQAGLADCDINQCIHNALSLMERQLSSHGIRLKQSLGRNLPYMHANPQGLEMVVVNLLSNAMQALDVSDNPDKIIRIVTMARAGTVILQVSDNGDGIIADQLNQIFEPFCTTKQSTSHWGLGLSIVQSITNSLGGTVQCWNDEPVGATFQIEIPL